MKTAQVLALFLAVAGSTILAQERHSIGNYKTKGSTPENDSFAANEHDVEIGASGGIDAESIENVGNVLGFNRRSLQNFDQLARGLKGGKKGKKEASAFIDKASSPKSTKAPSLKSTKAPSLKSTKAPSLKSTKAPSLKSTKAPSLKSTKAPSVRSAKKKKSRFLDDNSEV